MRIHWRKPSLGVMLCDLGYGIDSIFALLTLGSMRTGLGVDLTCWWFRRQIEKRKVDVDSAPR